MEWINIISSCKNTDPIVAYSILRDMSSKEVNDVLEMMEITKFYSLEEYRIQQQNNKQS